jgi:hypothetical protein
MKKDDLLTGAGAESDKYRALRARAFERLQRPPACAEVHLSNANQEGLHMKIILG